MPSTTQALSPSPQCRSWASATRSSSPSLRCCRPHVILDPRCPRARNVVILREPATSRALDIVEPMLSLSWQHHCPPQARKDTLNIFLCHFGPTNPDFDVLHCHISLICYIALTCRIALICYIATLLWYATLPHFFDIPHCFYSAALLWCATLPHCFDVLYCL
jgi:hypothetical protein